MSRILALSGSLRRDSFNTRLLKCLPRLAPEGMELELYHGGLGELPLFNEDLDTDPALAPVARLRAAIRAAEGLVIATPEYNQSLPGVLKNAIDWASRPHGRGALTGKAVVVMIATLGKAKGFRGLTDTTRILTGLGNLVVAEPEVVVPSAPSALADRADGTVYLTDPVAETLITIQLQVLADIVKTQAAAAAREAVERNAPTLRYLRFFSYVSNALREGASPAAVVERLVAAGIDADTATEWLVRAREQT
jgi:chromate reductase, NAD(P)H dehydrogenase (quinone)